jgi:outer membrane immunogenic protein
MKSYFIAAAALVSASSASAADFTGPWVEARGGWDSVQLAISANNTSITESQSGVVYGGAAGFDVAVGKTVVVGLQGGIYGTTAKVCSAVYGNDEACLSAGRDLEALARIGFRAGDNTLVYGLAGYANGRISASYVDFDDITNSGAVSDTGDGIRIGAGVEQTYSDGLYAKVEYRYTSYTKSDIGFGVDVGFNRHQVLVGAGYRF